MSEPKFIPADKMFTDPDSPFYETPASTHNPETGERLTWTFSQPPESLDQAVQEAVGGASACWDNLEGAGVFESERALEVSQALIDWINANYVSKVDAEEMRQQAVGDYQRKAYAGTPVEGQTTFGESPEPPDFGTPEELAQRDLQKEHLQHRFGSKPVYIDRAGRTHEL